MTDLRDRLRIYDQVSAPDLWEEAERRALALSAPSPDSGEATRGWRLILLIALLTVLIGGAAIGSGLIPLPIVPEPSPSPDLSSVPRPSATEPESPGPSLPPIDSATWTATGPMVNVRREGFTVTVLPDGKVLVAGGPGERGEALAEAEILDPSTLSWTATDVMVEGRTGHAAALLFQMVAVMGGGDESGLGSGGTFNSAEFFDLVRMDWSPFPRMIEPRVGHTATVLLDGRLLVVGGASNGEPSAEIIDPAVPSWSRTEDLVSADIQTATLLADGRVLVVGSSAQIFDPDTGTWSATEAMSERRGGHTATRLRDGRVLVAGGVRTGFAWSTASAELFDPATDSWSVTGSMTEPRSWFTSTLLPDGRVLVTGGGDGGFAGKASAEVYDARTSTWTAARDMLSPRGWHQAVALADGRVLVVGGYGTNAPADPIAEVFDLFGAK